MFIAVAQKDERRAPMRSGSPAQSGGHRGRRTTNSINVKNLLTNTDSVWFCGHNVELELESGYLTTLYSCDDCQRRAVTIGHDPFFYTFHWHRRGEI